MPPPTQSCTPGLQAHLRHWTLLATQPWLPHISVRSTVSSTSWCRLQISRPTVPYLPRLLAPGCRKHGLCSALAPHTHGRCTGHTRWTHKRETHFYLFPSSHECFFKVVPTCRGHRLHTVDMCRHALRSRPPRTSGPPHPATVLLQGRMVSLGQQTLPRLPTCVGCAHRPLVHQGPLP